MSNFDVILVLFLFEVSFLELYSINCLPDSYFAASLGVEGRKEKKRSLGWKRKKIKLFWSSGKKRSEFLYLIWEFGEKGREDF